jgi:hypothetical protein
VWVRRSGAPDWLLRLPDAPEAERFAILLDRLLDLRDAGRGKRE